MQECIASITPKTTIITPNRRLSTQLKRTFESQTLGIRQSPDIVPWDAWLQRCYEHLLLVDQLQPRLLTPEQSFFLWEEVLAKDSNATQILNPKACCEKAQLAWQLIHHWQLNWQDSAFQMMEDSKQFSHWAEQIKHRCKEQGWLTQEELAPWILKNVDQLLLPEKIIWYGFLELTPIQQQLKQQLENANVLQECFTPLSTKPQIQVKAFQQLDHELHAMARWAKDCYEKNPKERILCVIPNLMEIREKVEVIFRKTFYEKQLFTKASERAAYNISGGYSLETRPVIQTLFSLLELSAWRIDILLLSNLLRSPYLIGAQEESARSQLEFKLYEYGQSHLTRQQVLAFLANDAPILFDAFSKALQLDLKVKQVPSQWAQVILNWLLAFHWPGERLLGSDEYQQMMQLQSLLDNLAQFDDFLGECSWQKAVKTLKNLAMKAIFQVENPMTGVQVLGILEAVSHPCDRLWVAHLQNEIFPTTAKPNPFIPITLQKQKGLPHCDPKRELLYCSQLLKSLLQEAKDVCLSYPLQEADRVLAPSALLEEWGAASLHTINILRPLPLESLLTKVDKKGPQLSQEKMLKGGVGLIKSQALCGFQAFARYRLRAKTMNDLTLGLDALDRGILLHDVLQRFWALVKTQDYLLQEDCIDVITHLIQQVLSHYQREYPLLMTKAFAQIEQQRLQKLMQKWLALEKEREPFQIYALEHPIDIKLGPLSLRGQIDRIDRLATGEVLLIDYKTGITTINDWFSDHPSEPQLPLYALMQQEPLAGIVFAEVNLKKVRFNGVTARENQLPEVKALVQLNQTDKAEDWQGQLIKWQEILSQLATQFFEGHALIAPKDNKTCERCDLTSLCRYHMTKEHSA